MKTNFINSLIKYFIEKYCYDLIGSDNQPMDFTAGPISLIKYTQGTSILLEVIDADRCSNEQLEQMMARGMEVLENINGKNAYIYKLFLFDGVPEQEKLLIIERGQMDIPSEKRFLKCITVNISGREVKKCFSSPGFDAHITRSVKQFFSKNLEIRETSVQEIAELIAFRKKDYEIELKAKKPWLTYGLVAINVAVWLILTLISKRTGVSYDSLLNVYGAKVNSLILNGQYWRFITPMFLHSNEIHLLVNCYSLFIIGSEVEKLFGHIKFSIIYFVAGFLGCVASFAFSINDSVGASGAIFGLLGAMLYFAVKRPSLLKSSFGANLITNMVINLAYGFVNKRVDNNAHIGGLIGGFLTTAVVYTAKEETTKDKYAKVIALVMVAAVSIGGLFYGFKSENNAALQKLDTLDTYSSQKNYVEAEKLAEQMLQNKLSEDNKIQVLWNLGFSEIFQNKSSEAVEHAKQLKELSVVNGSYLLGIAYYQANELDKAKEELETAKKLGSNNVESINKILSEIEKNSTSK